MTSWSDAPNTTPAPLAPARGIAIALLIAGPFWGVLGVVWWVL